MSEAIKVALDALKARLERISVACQDTRPKQAVGEMIDAMLKMPEWKTALTALSEQKAEPVAYMHTWKDGGRRALSWKNDPSVFGELSAFGVVTIPLYAAPVPAKPVVAWIHPDALSGWETNDEMTRLVVTKFPESSVDVGFCICGDVGVKS